MLKGSVHEATDARIKVPKGAQWERSLKLISPSFSVRGANMPVKVSSVEELKRLAAVEDGKEFFILLNGNVRSVKRIEWDPQSQSFCVLNQIDDTHQDLTEQELASETNIVKAMLKGAFFLEDRW